MAGHLSFLLITFGMTMLVLMNSASLDSNIGSVEADVCFLEDCYTYFITIKGVCFENEAPEAHEGIEQWFEVNEGVYNKPGDTDSGYKQSGNTDGGYKQPGDTDGGYQQPRDTDGGYEQPGDTGGAYEQPGDTGGAYEQPGDTGGAYEQPGDTGGGYEQPGDTGGGYEQPGDTGGGYEQPGDTYDGYQLLVEMEGGHEIPKTITGIYPQPIDVIYKGVLDHEENQNINHLIDELGRSESQLIKAADPVEETCDQVFRKVKEKWTNKLFTFNEIFDTFLSSLNKLMVDAKEITKTSINYLENDEDREQLKKLYLEGEQRFFITIKEWSRKKNATVDGVLMKVTNLKCQEEPKPKRVDERVKPLQSALKRLQGGKPRDEKPIDWIKQKKLDTINQELNKRNELSEHIDRQDQKRKQFQTHSNIPDDDDDEKPDKKANRKVDLKQTQCEVPDTVEEIAWKQHGNWTYEVPEEYREMVEIKQKDLQQLWKARKECHGDLKKSQDQTRYLLYWTKIFVFYICFHAFCMK